MNQPIEERISIIHHFKSLTGWKNLPLEIRAKKLSHVGPFYYWLSNFLLILVILISVMVIFHFEPFLRNWQKSGLIVLMAASISFQTPSFYIEYLLLTHARKIMNSELVFASSLNDELSLIIKKINQIAFKNYLMSIPALLLVISALLQVFELNPIWKYFPSITLIVSVLLLLEMNYKIKLVNRNLKKVELLISA